MITSEEIRRRRLWSLEDEMWIDEVEATPEYEEAMEAIDMVLRSEFDCENPKLGQCHALWARQKELLKSQYGIDWLTPAELNPDIIFD